MGLGNRIYRSWGFQFGAVVKPDLPVFVFSLFGAVRKPHLPDRGNRCGCETAPTSVYFFGVIGAVVKPHLPVFVFSLFGAVRKPHLPDRGAVVKPYLPRLVKPHLPGSG